MRSFRENHRPLRVVLGATLLVALGACSSILDVKNPNNVAEAALSNPVSAAAQTSGVLASMDRMLSGLAVTYAVATDELDWIGSRDAWLDLDTGAISNYFNEFIDGSFTNVGEARYLADATIARLEGFNKAGTLTDHLLLARTYLYAAIIYTTIADTYDDFAFSTKTVAAPAVGRANMGKLYDTAVVYLNKAQTIAAAGSDNALKYNIAAYKARVKHAKGVWAIITPEGKNKVIANPLVNDAGAVADAKAAIALGGADQKFTLVDNLEATAGINIWFEVNGRNESRLGVVYQNLVDPVSGAKDPTVQALLAQFKAFGTQSGTFTMTSTRELRLILAEAALAGNDTAGFRTQLNIVRALDGKPAFTGQIPDRTMLAYERQAQLFLMRRRLSDMYRFGQKDSRWVNNPNFDSAFSCVGLLFPIPNVERLANPLIPPYSPCP